MVLALRHGAAPCSFKRDLAPPREAKTCSVVILEECTRSWSQGDARPGATALDDFDI